MLERKLTALFGLIVGCSARSPMPSPLSLPRESARAVVATTSSALVPAAPLAAVEPVPPLAPLPVEAVQELVAPGGIHSVALAEGSRVAALGEQPYLGDARGLRPLPLPPSLRAKPDEREDSRIFFGRDNEPRIMGARRSSARESPVYFRHTSAGWQDGREEIGQLAAAPRGGLWGVLGAADPELVCRVNAQCIIKRTTGWVTAPAGVASRRVELIAGTLWGLDSSGLANIDAHGWAVTIPAPAEPNAWTLEPRAFWATTGEAWVALGDELFHFRAGNWSRERAPITEPAAFWGVRSDSIWLVGKGGAAHFDGQSWRVLSVNGPFSAIAARTDSELWLGGAAGLFRIRP